MKKQQSILDSIIAINLLLALMSIGFVLYSLDFLFLKNVTKSAFLSMIIAFGITSIKFLFSFFLNELSLTEKRIFLAVIILIEIFSFYSSVMAIKEKAGGTKTFTQARDEYINKLETTYEDKVSTLIKNDQIIQRNLKEISRIEKYLDFLNKSLESSSVQVTDTNISVNEQRNIITNQRKALDLNNKMLSSKKEAEASIKKLTKENIERQELILNSLELKELEQKTKKKIKELEAAKFGYEAELPEAFDPYIVSIMENLQLSYNGTLNFLAILITAITEVVFFTLTYYFQKKVNITVEGITLKEYISKEKKELDDLQELKNIMESINEMSQTKKQEE